MFWKTRAERMGSVSSLNQKRNVVLYEAIFFVPTMYGFFIRIMCVETSISRVVGKRRTGEIVYSKIIFKNNRFIVAFIFFNLNPKTIYRNGFTCLVVESLAWLSTEPRKPDDHIFGFNDGRPRLYLGSLFVRVRGLYCCPCRLSLFFTWYQPRVENRRIITAPLEHRLLNNCRPPRRPRPTAG